MLGHCCAIWMVFKAYRPAMWPKKILNNNTLLLRVFFARFGAIWKPSWAYVGPELVHVWLVGGHVGPC